MPETINMGAERFSRFYLYIGARVRVCVTIIIIEEEASSVERRGTWKELEGRKRRASDIIKS